MSILEMNSNPFAAQLSVLFLFREQLESQDKQC